MTLTISELENDLQLAYAELKRQISCKASADRLMFQAQTNLTIKRRQLLRDTEPNDLGKNAEQREAKLAELCDTEQAQVTACERFQINDREHFDLAKVEVDRLKQLIKLAQIEAGTSE